MNYWLSPKLDGCHAYWTGRELLSRSRNRIRVPAWFTRDLPPMALEGELYAGVGTLPRVAGLVNRKYAAGDWSGMAFHLFDLPQFMLDPFGDVVARMNALSLPPHVKVIPQTLVRTGEEVRQHFRRVVDAGGEGICLRETGGTYHLDKLKPHTVEQRLQRCFLEDIA